MKHTPFDSRTAGRRQPLTRGASVSALSLTISLALGISVSSHSFAAEMPSATIVDSLGAPLASCSFEYGTLSITPSSGLALTCVSDIVTNAVVTDAMVTAALIGRQVTIDGELWTLADENGDGTFELVSFTQNNTPPVATNVTVNPPITAGTAETAIDLLALGGANDADPGDTWSLSAVNPKDGPLGGESVTFSGATISYTPPMELTQDTDRVFVFTVTDNAGALSNAAELTIPVLANNVPTTCDRVTGAGCFGQTWEGDWYTLEEELAGGITEPLFVPRAGTGNYHTAIFSNVDEDRETHWGCGPENATVVDYPAVCDFRASLVGNVTYIMRLPVSADGTPLRNRLYLTTAETLDKLGSYLFEMAADVGPIDAAAPDGNRLCATQTPGAMWTFYGPTTVGSIVIPGCEFLDQSGASGTWSQLYLKFKGVGADAANCAPGSDTTKHCRMYMNAW